MKLSPYASIKKITAIITIIPSKLLGG